MKTKFSIFRDDNWLLSRLDRVWTAYFPEVSQTNKIFIKFGRFAKLRLGSIRLDKKTKASSIIITGMFKDSKVPVEVIDHTIAHELVHYTHGFSSLHPRLHRYPHEGGVVRRELEGRGMDKLLSVYKKWVKDYRKEIYARHLR
ncbi:MAG: hypothetical protein G01um101493_266 [Microgenomates group bacterium Gr01-1014_93]|nr:MAG: hypothetical protein G01um101493_266 [Microgenomates group bacterium Gr01-1014_93]